MSIVILGCSFNIWSRGIVIGRRAVVVSYENREFNTYFIILSSGVITSLQAFDMVYWIVVFVRRNLDISLGESHLYEVVSTFGL